MHSWYDYNIDSPTFGIKVLFQFGLLEIGMALDLVHSWYNLGCLKQMFCFRDCKVGDTNGLHQPL